MANLQNIFGMIGGITQSLRAADITAQGASIQAQQSLIGGEIAAQGSLFQAAGFRQSAVSLGQANTFNLAIDKINLQRQLQATSRQFQRTVGTQMTQQAGTGLSLTSKSYLMVRNESADLFSRAMLNMKVDAENTKRSKIFETQVRQMNLENQARGAEYQAAAERVLASNRAAMAEWQGEQAQNQAFSSAIGKLPTLLSAIVN